MFGSDCPLTRDNLCGKNTTRRVIGRLGTNFGHKSHQQRASKTTRAKQHFLSPRRREDWRLLAGWRDAFFFCWCVRFHGVSQICRRQRRWPSTHATVYAAARVGTTTVGSPNRGLSSLCCRAWAASAAVSVRSSVATIFPARRPLAFPA